MIYHIVKKDKWLKNKTSIYYTPNSLDREGYVHCSFKEQVMKVADSFHKGQNDLLILCIDEAKVGNNYKVEDLFNLNEKYPHIYGSVPLSSIEKVVELKVTADGNFIEPNLDPLSSLLVKEKEWT